MTSYMNYCICRDTNIYRSCLQDGYGFAVATIYFFLLIPAGAGGAGRFHPKVRDFTC